MEIDQEEKKEDIINYVENDLQEEKEEERVKKE